MMSFIESHTAAFGILLYLLLAHEVNILYLIDVFNNIVAVHSARNDCYLMDRF